MRAKIVPVCRYVYPGGVWKLPHQPWLASRETAADALRDGRKRGQVLRLGLGNYLLLGLADQVMTTR